MSTPISNHLYGYQSAIYDTKVKAVENTEKAEQEQETSSVPKTDTFVKSPQYKPDMEKVQSMKADLSNNVAAFKKMVQGLFKNQGMMAESTMNQLMEIDQATQAQAQQAISEDGEWGVEKTAMRILEFAKAISGGDSSKMEALRGAVQQGFAAAEKVWGSTLPEISYKTLDRVMQGFDQWANEGKTEA